VKNWLQNLPSKFKSYRYSKDLRLEPGKTLKLTGDEKLGPSRRLLADAVAGGDFFL
jgi:hypothetical protein